MEPEQIVAWATVALAIAAATLALITYLMANESQTARERSEVPMCRCDLRAGPEENGPSELNVAVSIENVGSSPAVEARVALQPENSDGSAVAPPLEGWYIGTIASWHHGVEPYRAQWSLPTGVTSISVVTDYKNTDRAGFRTQARFELVDAKSAPGALRRNGEASHWVKRSETFQLTHRWWHLGPLGGWHEKR
ncbi:MAG TPA: hypothetical protein VGK54_09305 [Chloroflexota bacterium]